MAGAAIKENCGCVIKRVCVGLKDVYRALDPARQEDGVSGRKGGAMLIFVIMAAVAGAQDVPTPEHAATPVMGPVLASAQPHSEPVLLNVDRKSTRLNSSH